MAPGDDSVSRTAQLHDVSALGVKVQGLEIDVRDLKVGITAIAAEMRTSFNSLSIALNERNRTPWVSILSGAGVVVTTMAFIGTLALAPIQRDIATLQNQQVPRVELDKRGAALDQRLDATRETDRNRIEDLTQRMLDAFAARDKSLDRIFQDLQGLKARVETAKDK